MTTEEKRQAEILINNDFDHAKDKAQGFIVAYLAQLNFRCESLNNAMLKAVDLLKLPPHSSALSHIWDIAFTAMSTACPLLGVGKALKESEKAIVLAAALGNKTAKVLKVLPTAGELVEKINKGKEGYEKVAKEVREARQEPEGMAELSKYDMDSDALDEMLDNANQAIAIWGTALAILNDEKMFRELDIEQQFYKPTESLRQLADRLLPKPLDPLTKKDRKQLELRYLWEILKGYSKNFTIVYALRMGAGVVRPMDTYVEGLNDNQQDTLVELFGPDPDDSPRGKTFYMPPVNNIYMLLAQWGVKSRRETQVAGMRLPRA